MAEWWNPLANRQEAMTTINNENALVNEFSRQRAFTDLSKGNYSAPNSQGGGNALVQQPAQFTPSNYGEALAAQQYAQQYMNVYGPSIVVAQDTGNNDLKDQIATQFMNSGIPQLSQMGTVLKGANFTGKDETEWTAGSLKTLSDEHLTKFGLNHKMLAEMNDDTTIHLKGRLGGQMYPTKIVPFKTPASAMKDREISVPGTEEAINRLLNSENISEPIKQNLNDWKARLHKMKPNERPLNFQLKYDKDGDLVGIKDTYSPAPVKVSVTNKMGGEPSWPFPKEQQDYWFERTAKDYKTNPFSGMGAAAAAERARYYRDFAAWDIARRKGLGEHPGTAATLEATEFAGTRKEYEALQKNYGAMNAFINNIDGQVNRIKQLAKKLPSADRARIFNVPINEARRIIFGDPKLSAYRMYITEIASEAGKLAQGSQASVSQLGEGARETWDKIHDKNMPLSKMIELLDEVENAGKIRKQGQEKAISDAKRRLSTTTGSMTFDKWKKETERRYKDRVKGWDESRWQTEYNKIYKR
jgi:hypothetical protein